MWVARSARVTEKERTQVLSGAALVSSAEYQRVLDVFAALLDTMPSSKSLCLAVRADVFTAACCHLGVSCVVAVA